MEKKTIKDIDVAGKRVLTRVDFNVPMDEDGNITDDTRIRAALPTVNYLMEHGAKVILISHLGRPGGRVDEKYRMDPVADRLSRIMGKVVHKLDDCIGKEVEDVVKQMRDGEVLLLENVRFYGGEKKNEKEFARALAALADVFVNDAFGAAHRAHASTTGVARFLPAVAGFLMQKELTVLGKLLADPERPFVTVIGGAKVSDKIGVLNNMLEKVDALLVGGGMANTFLSAAGYDMGSSLVESDKQGEAKKLLEKAEELEKKLVLPVDVIAANALDPGAEREIATVEGIPQEWMVLDIGPETIRIFINEIKGAKTIFWNGPMGVFEMEPFAGGTEAVARALGESDALTIVGGGDSAAALKKINIVDQIDHISTGGGASLEFLEGKTLPGVAALEDMPALSAT